MKLTEQYDGHTFCHSGKMLKVGTKKNGLTYSVVLLTNPEWSVVIIKIYDYLHSCIARAPVMDGVAIFPDLFSLRRIPLNWKEHIFHTAVLATTNQSQRMVYGQEGF